MFALREIAICLAFFVLLYSFLSALVAVTWRLLRLLPVSKKIIADLLFALRVLPLLASITLTLAFVVPSFQMLEPRSVDERMGTMPVMLGICAVLLILTGCLRMIAAHRKTRRMVAQWLDGARPMDTDGNANTVTIRAEHGAPPIVLVGVYAPRVLVSESTVEILSNDELRIALKHEFAHMQSRDNLKKLVFRFCLFPGMTELENTWSQTTEMAADSAAVSKVGDAVDLAAALVKLSRLLPGEATAVCTVGFMTGSISDRVARLLAWNAAESRDARLRPYAIPAVLITLLFVFFTYGPALRLTHEVTEWLVR
jgi:Zn-dependent protease with chaperone function